LTRRSSRTSGLFGSESARTSAEDERNGLRYYLLVYDAAAQRLADGPDEYVDGDDAQTAFVAAEERLRGQDWLQVVMFVARSLDNVRSTHPHYFEDAAHGGGETAEFLIPRA
jgi:hypothetical protein